MKNKNDEKPAVPSSPSPATGAKNVTLTPSLSWKALGATSNEVRFGTAYPPPYLTTTTGLTANPGNLAPHTKYIWKVISRNDFGASASDAWTLTTQTAGPPLPPTTPNPPDKGKGSVLTPTLKWKGGLGATSFDVYFGTTATPPLVRNVTVRYYGPGPLKTGTKYYWRIVAKNGPDSTSSALWSVTTKLVPDRPTVPSPANGVINVVPLPTLGWSAAVGATSYMVYFGTDPAPKLVGTVTGTTNKPTGTFAPNRKYYWRIVAVSQTGNQPSVTWSFKTQ